MEEIKEGFYFVKWNATGNWDVSHYSDGLFQVSGSEQCYPIGYFSEIVWIEPPTDRENN